MNKKIVILGGGESGVGAAILAKKKGLLLYSNPLIFWRRGGDSSLTLFQIITGTVKIFTPNFTPRTFGKRLKALIAYHEAGGFLLV